MDQSSYSSERRQTCIVSTRQRHTKGEFTLSTKADDASSEIAITFPQHLTAPVAARSDNPHVLRTIDVDGVPVVQVNRRFFVLRRGSSYTRSETVGEIELASRVIPAS